MPRRAPREVAHLASSEVSGGFPLAWGSGRGLDEPPRGGRAPTTEF